MISNLLLVLGVAVLSLALRSFPHRVLFRMGTYGLLVTSFLAGWLLGGSVWLGAALVASWLFLPWLEILTRIRHLRLPIDRTLRQRTPPNRTAFPGFPEMSEEIEELGFEHVEDTGWQHGEERQFYRVWNAEARRTQACLCLAEQQDFSFFYFSLTSRTEDGRVFMTWNYPFSYGLKLPPDVRVARYPGTGPFADMLAAHEKFLASEGSLVLANPAPEEIIHTMQREMRDQITHNIQLGLLEQDGEKLIRYTRRGMVFLWMQFLRDFVRLS